MDRLQALREVEEEPLTYRRLLDCIYRLPNDLVSLQDYERRRHRDIERLSEAALKTESRRSDLRGWLDDDPDAVAWLEERSEQTERELRRWAREKAQLGKVVQVFGPPLPSLTSDAAAPPAGVIPGMTIEFTSQERAS